MSLIVFCVSVLIKNSINLLFITQKRVSFVASDATYENGFFQEGAKSLLENRK